ncbi:small ribosomal subunit Rsm22 family protein [Jatrophihabitans sp. YIM 134969]
MRAVDLPAPVSAALATVGRGGNPAAARALSERYRARTSSASGPVLRSGAELAAYATVRFPATYAAAVAACRAVASNAPDLAPTSLLDVGSGLGATACAAVAVWPSLTTLTLVEPDERAVAAGRTVLAAAAPDARVTWVTGDWTAASGPADLVTAGYVGNELADPVGFARRLWDATSDVLLLLEPGRREAYAALLDSRDALLEAGAHTLAPCPHDERCPLPRSDWCHFGQRLPRSSAHRHLKGAEENYEDEKYSYVALGRRAAARRPDRVLRRPTRRKGLVELQVCAADGTTGPVRVAKSSSSYREAKDVEWGDTWPTSG